MNPSPLLPKPHPAELDEAHPITDYLYLGSEDAAVESRFVENMIVIVIFIVVVVVILFFGNSLFFGWCLLDG